MQVWVPVSRSSLPPPFCFFPSPPKNRQSPIPTVQPCRSCLLGVSLQGRSCIVTVAIDVQHRSVSLSTPAKPRRTCVAQSAGAQANSRHSASRFKIKDDEIGRDSLAAWACIRLDRLREGYRCVQLYDFTGEKSGGVLLVRVTKQAS